jgi:mono/diheme cytochrome c family protein
MLTKLKLYRFSWLMPVIIVVLAACGDNTATSTTVPATATTSAATTVPTTVAVSSTTVAATTTVAITTVVATTAARTTAAVTTPPVAAPVTTAAVALDPQKVAAGKKVFVAQCQGCHPQEGKAAGYGPNLSTSQHALDPNYVRGNVRNGRGQMIAFDKSEVSDADLENIILYLRSIHQG